jgi:hypothetical protein
MIGFAAPGFLLAGGIVALAAVALHLLVRSPPNRAPLPTARFLASTPRAAVRVQRTPRDLLLLALRVLFALSFAAAFSRPVWRAERDDAAHVVVIDRGAGMAAVWTAAVDSARLRARRGDAVLLFDTSAVWVTRSDPAFFDSLRAAGPAMAESDYRVAFRELARIATIVPAGAYRGTLVTVPRWSAWRDGTATARRAAWPGALELIALPADAAAGVGPQRFNSGEAASGGHVVRVAAAAGSALRDAVEALGWVAVDTTVVGANIVRFVQANGEAGADSTHGNDGVVIFRGGWTAPAVRPRSLTLTHANGTRAVAAWRDGMIAAYATADTTGCTVTTAFALHAEPVIANPLYPELVRRLVEACHPDFAAENAAPLDRAAVALLRGTGAAELDAAALPGGSAGRPLGRPLLALALLCAVAEWPLRQRRGRQMVA